jgi:NTE family protein
VVAEPKAFSYRSIKAGREWFPIDYVAGTSMGAIVGSMYAMGLTPEEMMKIIKSDDFKYWLTGQDEPEYVAYFRNGDQKPEFMGVSFRFNPHDTVKVKSNILPTHIVPTHQLNYAFLALFSQATAISDKNFDRLFVPVSFVWLPIFPKSSSSFQQRFTRRCCQSFYDFSIGFQAYRYR